MYFSLKSAKIRYFFLTFFLYAELFPFKPPHDQASGRSPEPVSAADAPFGPADKIFGNLRGRGPHAGAVQGLSDPEPHAGAVQGLSDPEPHAGAPAAPQPPSGSGCFRNKIRPGRWKAEIFVLSLIPYGLKTEHYMKEQFVFDYERYTSLEELPAADRQLVREAEQATGHAYAPYSHFHVGAAARLRSGRILHGSNFESEVFPAGLCAERALLFHAQSDFPDDPVETLAVASAPSQRECYPCGQCRQVLLDVERRQGSPIRIVMSGNGSATVVGSAALLLPFNFIL